MLKNNYATFARTTGYERADVLVHWICFCDQALHENMIFHSLLPFSASFVSWEQNQFRRKTNHLSTIFFGWLIVFLGKVSFLQKDILHRQKPNIHQKNNEHVSPICREVSTKRVNSNS